MLLTLLVVLLVIALLRASFRSLPPIVRVVGLLMFTYILGHWLTRGSWDFLYLLFHLAGLAVILLIVGSMIGAHRSHR